MTDALLAQIKGEYREMPGLSLTLPQACRLWQLDVHTCRTVLAALIADGTLYLTPHGGYVALPSPRRHTARASLLTRVRAAS